ncbi:MAG: hypothetical protein ACPG5T_07030, partial [Endozoicomonas sp.]
ALSGLKVPDFTQSGYSRTVSWSGNFINVLLFSLVPCGSTKVLFSRPYTPVFMLFGCGTPSQNSLEPQGSARDSGQFMKFPGWSDVKRFECGLYQFGLRYSLSKLYNLARALPLVPVLVGAEPKPVAGFQHPSTDCIFNASVMEWT